MAAGRGVTQAQSRQIGRAVMALSALPVLLYAVALRRRSVALLAIPAGLAVAAGAALTFWVGYTMTTTDWDNPADYPPPEPHRPPQPERPSQP